MLLSVPATEKLLELVVMPAKVRLLKTKLFVAPPLLAIEPPVMVMVPAVGAKVLPELTVKAPATEKLAEGWLVGVPAMVKPANVRILLLVIPQPVPAKVMVPVGINDCEALTVKVPEIEKLAEGCEEGVPSIVSPLKVSVPLLTMFQLVPVIVTVPFEGAKPEPVLALLVNVPAILKLVVVCVLGVVEMVMPLKVKAVPLLVIFQPVPVK